jgi:hypothetical protein
MKFFVKFRIYELTEELWNKGLHIPFQTHSTGLVPSQRYYSSSINQNECGMNGSY